MTDQIIQYRSCSRSIDSPLDQRASRRGPRKQIAACGVLILGLALCLSGCGGHKSADKAAAASDTNTNQVAESGNPTTTAAAENHVPVYTPPATPAFPAVQANGEPDLGEMNRALRRWLIRNRRRPTSFEDFAALADVQVPPAPTGKKYVITKQMHIVLEAR